MADNRTCTIESYDADRDHLFEDLSDRLPDSEQDPDGYFQVASALVNALNNAWFEGISLAQWRADTMRRMGWNA